jgi:predicted O-methyltransferase YrrM
MFANALRKAGGQSYVNLELNTLCAAIARAMVAFAGLDDIVEILKVQCRASLQQLTSANFGSKAREMVFFMSTNWRN